MKWTQMSQKQMLIYDVHSMSVAKVEILLPYKYRTFTGQKGKRMYAYMSRYAICPLRVRDLFYYINLVPYTSFLAGRDPNRFTTTRTQDNKMVIYTCSSYSEIESWRRLRARGSPQRRRVQRRRGSRRAGSRPGSGPRSPRSRGRSDGRPTSGSRAFEGGNKRKWLY